ncbi:unnamed protein product [Adineta ricciae]|uniref:Uncharacterized protein n=2 Tax=Adineta ricciae TaxID=249248 RepID=A0A813SLL9_ADIRI|nr:unnamed protein product [Adineta ricciae]
MQRMNQTANESTKHIRVSTASTSPSSSLSSSSQLGKHSPPPDLLWISKQQQQHPLTHVHPLKNTVRVNANGVRFKFDGKQWRALCEASDDYECRNLAFRSSLCQKHFYKVHKFKRPYTKSKPQLSLKQPVNHPHYHPSNGYHNSENKEDCMYEEDNSIEMLDTDELKLAKTENYNKELRNASELEFTYFSINCDSQSESYAHELQQMKTQSHPNVDRISSRNDEFLRPNSSDPSSYNISIPKITESIHLGLPPLTRTEEKSLANELMIQLPADVTLTVAEQIARHRASEIVMDNFSHQLSPKNITCEWFYDFLLRNPRLPIHFPSWFSSVKPVLPASDQIIDIKIWELGLITRSVLGISSSSHSTSSSSP